MKFLDEKEQVLDIQLTSFGKHLLSKGLFKPCYYEFFDDDVIYDYQSTGFISESQNSIQDRIFETPRLETQTNYGGIERQILEKIKFVRDNVVLEDQQGVSIQNEIDRNLSLKSPIGSIKLESTNAPAWNINVLNGELTSSLTYLSGTNAIIKIPQLNCKDVLFKRQVKTGMPVSNNILREMENAEAGNDTGLLSVVFPDGSYLDVDEDFLLLKVEELNIEDDGENFEMEIYEILSGNLENEEKLVPLFFYEKPYVIQDDLLVMENEARTPEINKNFINYYLNIKTDADLPNEIICSLPKEDRPFDVVCLDNQPTNTLYDEETDPEEKC